MNEEHTQQQFGGPTSAALGPPSSRNEKVNLSDYNNLFFDFFIAFYL